MIKRWFVTVPKTLETLLSRELKNCGGMDIVETRAGVFYKGDLEAAYRVILWSRLASRILLQLNEFSANKTSDIYEGVKQTDWNTHMNIDSSFVVHCEAKGNLFTNAEFLKKIVKDAIVDQFRESTGERPSINKSDPDMTVHLIVNQTEVNLALDMTISSLHKRGYRLQQGEAPLRENIAAALLIRAGWPEKFADCLSLVDPMCGAGTIVIEAALMAANIAPGIVPGRAGLNNWKGHNQSLWDKLFKEAELKRKNGLTKQMSIMGYDNDSAMIEIARKNAARAQIEHSVRFICADYQNIPTLENSKTGLVAVNPPYGKRIADQKPVMDIYKNLGRLWHKNFSNWKAVLITSDKVYARAIGLRASKLNSIYNGTIPCVVAQYDLDPDNEYRVFDPGPGYQQGLEPRVKLLSAQADALLNRFQKNHRRLEPWLKRNQISCFRLYDADMPQFAAAVDVYEGKWAVIQEYTAPASIDPVKANDRLHTILDIVARYLHLDNKHIFLKHRQKLQDGQQYQKLNHSNHYEEIMESGLRFLVNFSDYIDTGIYLDHRTLRSMIRDISFRKSFLNLFSYTSSATVYALAGNARFARSVDTSNTYLAWSEANLKRNKCNTEKYSLVRSDCFEWLDIDSDKYDLILCDAPTWSVGKDRRTFDVQKDHVALIKKAVNRLNPNGSLFFSTHFKKFVLDWKQLDQYQVRDLTHKTIPKDYARSKHIHKCWHIKKV